MKNTPIRAVLFDMGGTLENIYYDDALRLEATRGLKGILGDNGLDRGLSVSVLYQVVSSGMKRYGVWREQSEQELPASRIWSEYVLADQDLPADQVAAIGEDLALYYDLHFFRRELRPEARPLLNWLRERKIRMGVISNVYSRRAVPINLVRYELDSYFDAVVTSAAFGWRKPNPAIFLETARQMQMRVEECAYVGDTVSRDVAGARRSGYGRAIQIKSFLTERSDTDKDTEQPDAVIRDLSQVSDLIMCGPEPNNASHQGDLL